MSELSDSAAALRAIHNSLTSIEKYAAEQVANTQYLRESFHELKNQLTIILAERDITDSKLAELDKWMATCDSRLTILADDVTAGFRADRAEISRLRGLRG